MLARPAYWPKVDIGCAYIQALSVWSFENFIFVFARALVLLRRQQAASYPRLRLIASTFFDNLVQLRRLRVHLTGLGAIGRALP